MQGMHDFHIKSASQCVLIAELIDHKGHFQIPLSIIAVSPEPLLL